VPVARLAGAPPLWLVAGDWTCTKDNASIWASKFGKALMDPLATKDVEKFLSKKLTKAQCSECGGKNFGMIEEETDKKHAAITLYDFPDYDLDTASTIDVVVVICADCGGLRSFSRDQVAKWIKNNP
jgi:hypothetical protein